MSDSTESNVVDIFDKTPSIVGEAKCLVCKSEWVATAPVGVGDNLDCPTCGSGKGFFKDPVNPADGVEVFEYHCGC